MAGHPVGLRVSHGYIPQLIVTGHTGHGSDMAVTRPGFCFETYLALGILACTRPLWKKQVNEHAGIA